MLLKAIITPIRSRLVSLEQLGPDWILHKKAWLHESSPKTNKELRLCSMALDSSGRELVRFAPDGDGANLSLVVKDLSSGEEVSKVFSSEQSSEQSLVGDWLFLTPQYESDSTTVINWRTGHYLKLQGNHTAEAYSGAVLFTRDFAREDDSEYMVALNLSNLEELWREEGFFGKPCAIPVKEWLVRGRAQKPYEPKSKLEIVDIHSGKVIKATPIQFGPVCAKTEKFLYFLSDGYVGELNLESLSVRKIETGLRCAKDFQILDDHILFQVPDDGNCEGGGCLYLQDIRSGEIVGRWAWPSTYDWARASHVEPVGEGYYGILLRNGDENKSWSYWRYFVFKPEELLEAEPEVEYEPLMVSFVQETDEHGYNRYRVSMPDDCEDLVTYFWQMEVGAHSCADIHGFSGLVEDKPFDEDFAGEIILDCRNIPFERDKESLGAALVESGRSFCNQYKILDAVDHEPIRFRCEFLRFR